MAGALLTDTVCCDLQSQYSVFPGGGFQLQRHAGDPVGQLFAAQFFSQSGNDQRERQRCESGWLSTQQLHRLHVVQGADQSGVFQLPFQDLCAGLREQQVVRIVTGEHVVQQSAAGLQLSGRTWLSGKPLEHQPGDSGDFPKLSFSHFGGVDALSQIWEQ